MILVFSTMYACRFLYNKVDMEEGLSSVNYSVVDMKELDLYTWVLVDLNGRNYIPPIDFLHAACLYPVA